MNFITKFEFSENICARKVFSIEFNIILQFPPLCTKRCKYKCQIHLLFGPKPGNHMFSLKLHPKEFHPKVDLGSKGHFGVKIDFLHKTANVVKFTLKRPRNQQCL